MFLWTFFWKYFDWLLRTSLKFDATLKTISDLCLRLRSPSKHVFSSGDRVSSLHNNGNYSGLAIRKIRITTGQMLCHPSLRDKHIATTLSRILYEHQHIRKNIILLQRHFASFRETLKKENFQSIIKINQDQINLISYIYVMEVGLVILLQRV